MAESDYGDRLEVEFEGMRECCLEYLRRVAKGERSLSHLREDLDVARGEREWV